MPTQREPLVIGPFAGGLNTYDDPTAVRDTELVEALNWDPGLEGSLRSRPPFSQDSHPIPLGTTGNPLFLGYYYLAGVAYLIVGDGNSSTWAFNGSAWLLVTNTISASAMVQFDNKASNRFTVVEVNAKDRPALLNRLARALFEAQLVVHSAHIATYGERAADTFYVTDLFGHKVDRPDRLRAVEDKLLAAANAAEQTGDARTGAVEEYTI